MYHVRRVGDVDPISIHIGTSLGRSAAIAEAIVRDTNSNCEVMHEVTTDDGKVVWPVLADEYECVEPSTSMRKPLALVAAAGVLAIVLWSVFR